MKLSAKNRLCQSQNRLMQESMVECDVWFLSLQAFAPSTSEPPTLSMKERGCGFPREKCLHTPTGDHNSPTTGEGMKTVPCFATQRIKYSTCSGAIARVPRKLIISVKWRKLFLMKLKLLLKESKIILNRNIP